VASARGYRGRRRVCTGRLEVYDVVAPTPEEFWGNADPDTLNVGGRPGTDVEAFKRWLLARLA
jgi:hypothetical protein